MRQTGLRLGRLGCSHPVMHSQGGGKKEKGIACAVLLFHPGGKASARTSQPLLPRIQPSTHVTPRPPAASAHPLTPHTPPTPFPPAPCHTALQPVLQYLNYYQMMNTSAKLEADLKATLQGLANSQNPAGASYASVITGAYRDYLFRTLRVLYEMNLAYNYATLTTREFEVPENLNALALKDMQVGGVGGVGGWAWWVGRWFGGWVSNTACCRVGAVQDKAAWGPGGGGEGQGAAVHALLNPVAPRHPHNAGTRTYLLPA